jgi:hypothetical protein
MSENSNIHDEQFDKRLVEKFGKEMPYELPESYFENYPERILDIARMNSGRKNYFLHNTATRIAAAAAILLIVAFALVYMFSNNSEIEVNLTDINDLDAYWHNISSLAELEESYLISLIDTDSLNIECLMLPDTSGISDEAIVEYLLAENHIEYLLTSEY